MAKGVFILFLMFFALILSAGITVPPGKSWDFPLLNTAGKAEYLSAKEKEVILEINKLRSDPAAYAVEYLEPLINCYQGHLLHLPGKIRVRTREGVSALTDAIRFLKKSSPVPVLSPDQKLALASRDHLKDQSVRGGTGHTGSDGSGAQSRIRRYGRYSRAVGENIFTGKKIPGWWCST